MSLITWEITTDSKREPVSVTEVKEHLREDRNDSSTDAYIKTLIKSARYRLEAATGRALFTQTRQLRLVSFPPGNKILLPGYPVASITSVKYYDDSGVQQTWSSAEYSLKDSKPNWLQLGYDYDFPTHRSSRDEIEIEYICGESSVSSIDPRVFHAIYLDVELNYDGYMDDRRRGAAIRAYDSLVDQLKIGEDFLDYGESI